MYQIYWKNEKGVKECLLLNCTEEEKDDIMNGLKNYSPECFERLSSGELKTIQTIKKEHKPIQRGARYLTSQSSFGLKPQGETLYTYMIPDLGYKKLSEYFDVKWVSERDGKPVELIGLVWRTIPEIKKLCADLRIKKLVWLMPVQEEDDEYINVLEESDNG